MLWVGHKTWREVHWAISMDMGKMTRRTPPNTEVTLQLADALITSLVTLDELTTPCLSFLFYNMGTIPMPHNSPGVESE